MPAQQVETQQKADVSASASYPLNHNESLSSEDLQNLGVIGDDPFGLTHRPMLALFLLFLAGVTLAFTPCVLPMLPIVANIVAEQKNPSLKRSFLLSSGYGLGVATAYGLLGALIAFAGESVGLLGVLQSPIILLSFAVIFVVLGLYMLEIINIRLPQKISQKLHHISQAGNHKLGSISGSFLVGLLSALVVSPCVSAPLSGALFAVASIGNVALGFMALFMLGFGLCVPLVLFATTEGKLLPQVGEWMNSVKHGFAYLMFAVALMMIERVFQSPFVLILWAVWFAVMAWWAWQFAKHLPFIPKNIARIISLLAIIWACCLGFGAVNGATDSLNPLKTVLQEKSNNHKIQQKTAKKTTLKITNLQQLDKILISEQAVIVDIMADWCIECRIMEEKLFVNPPQQLSNWQVVKLDLTETTADSKAVLKRYQIVGPPTLLYYSQGQLLTKQVGQVKRKNFENLLEVLNENNINLKK